MSYMHKSFSVEGTSDEDVRISLGTDTVPVRFSAIAKIIFRQSEMAAIIRDLSDTGFTAELSTALLVDEEVIIEMKGLAGAKATVRKVSGTIATCEFQGPCNINRVLNPFAANGFQLRDPRFELRTPARLRMGTYLIQTNTIDISEEGAKLDLSATDIGTDVDWEAEQGKISLLNIRGLGHPQLGHICWFKDRKLGFKFQNKITVADLDCILNAADQSQAA